MDKPSERIKKAYYATVDAADVSDIRREMDALHERVCALEQKDQSWINKIGSAAGYVGSDAHKMPKDEKPESKRKLADVLRQTKYMWGKQYESMAEEALKEVELALESCGNLTDNSRSFVIKQLREELL